MSAATSSFSPALSALQLSSASKTQEAPSSLGFSSVVSKTLNPLIAKATRGVNSVSGGGSALGARMVSMPTVKPPVSLDFETSVFKKEKINLAGHNEVSLLIIKIHFWVCLVNLHIGWLGYVWILINEFGKEKRETFYSAWAFVCMFSILISKKEKGNPSMVDQKNTLSRMEKEGKMLKYCSTYMNTCTFMYLLLIRAY